MKRNKSLYIKLTEEKCFFIYKQQRRNKDMSAQKAVKSSHYEAESNMEQDVCNKFLSLSYFIFVGYSIATKKNQI